MTPEGQRSNASPFVRSFPNWVRLAMTLVLGLTGGAIFALLDLPVPWLSGAMLAVACGALAGLKAYVPDGVRTLVFVTLGLSMGIGISPDLVARAGAWPASLALSYVMVAVESSKADLARVALLQSSRVVLLVAVLPWVITALGGHDMPIARVQPSIGIGDVLLLAGLGSAGDLLLQRSGIPAGALVGAFLVSSILYGMGIVSGKLPDGIVAGGLVALGCTVGLRLSGISLSLLRRTLFAGMGAFMLGLGVSALGAAFASHLLGFPFSETLLAFTPGGLETMMILAVALDLDPTYVAIHQFGRFLAMIIVIPAVARMVLGRTWNGRPD